MSNFNLYARKKKSGKSVYYVRFKKSDGLYTTALSTGCTSKLAAREWAENHLIDIGIPVTGRNVTFKEFSKNFFDWDGTWALNKRSQGLRLSKSHCLYTAKTVEKHVLPVFGNTNLADIDKLKIRDFRNTLFKQGWSGSLINKALYAIKIILDAAEERGYIKGVPKIEKAVEKPKIKGILTIDEVRELFTQPWMTNTYPEREQLHGFVGNLLACVSGLRLGEIQGLLLSDLHIEDGYITVRRSWNRILCHLNETTKNGKIRNILIPSYAASQVERLVKENPGQSPDSFLFFSFINSQPVDSKVFINSFFNALKKIGISEVERKQRNITFHSHRHWFNSLLLNARIPLHKVQSLTGHLSDEMTELYYHTDDMADVKQIQEELFSDKIN
jgi:integrase